MSDEKQIAQKNRGKLRRGGPGRPKGVPNKATIEIKQFAMKMLADPKYGMSLQRRLINGEAPHMETLLHQYAYGKPKDHVEITGADGGPLAVLFTVNPGRKALDE